ncbi:MAG: peptidylprolyl isomerase [Gammaproteobacteria bacterium]|nr:peptidylprolyl isomerase [Gammaproteobacteria bacterium]
MSSVFSHVLKVGRLRIALAGVSVLIALGMDVVHADESAIIATSRDMALTRQQLALELSVLPPDVLNQLGNDPQSALTFVNGLMKLRAFTAEAERTGVAAKPQVRAAVETARARIFADALRQHQIEVIQEPDFEALALERYKADKERYRTPEKMRVRHILLKLPADAPEALVTEKRAQLDAVAARVRGGEAFDALAREFSEDESSAGLGGELPAFGRGQMVPPFEAAAFAARTRPTQRGGAEPVWAAFDRERSLPAWWANEFRRSQKNIIAKLRVDYRHDYLAAWEQDLLKAVNVQVSAEQLRVLMADARARLAQQPAGAAGLIEGQ